MENIHKLENKYQFKQLIYVKIAVKSGKPISKSDETFYADFERKFDIISELRRFAKNVSFLIQLNFFKINDVSIKKYLNSIKLNRTEKKIIDKIFK